MYLAHLIDIADLHPTEGKLAAMCDAARFKDAAALKSFLGLMMFSHVS